MSVTRAPGPFARLSLRHKVPLVAALLILLVGAAISTASYMEARHSAWLAARQHVVDLVQLVGAGQRTGSQVLMATRRMAARPVIAAFLAAPTPEHRAAVITAFGDPPNPNVVASQLFDRDGHLLLGTDSLVDRQQGDFPVALAAIGDSGVVGPIRLVQDSLVYPVSVPVVGTAGATFVQWRKLSSGADANRRTQQAIGATILIGNSDGSFWTDLTKLVTAPPPAVRESKVPLEYTRDRREGAVLGGFMPMLGTPWIFAAEIPLNVVMAPANAFFRQILIITLCCVLIGAIAAWAFALRLTTPLIELTEAADAMAAGQRTAAVRIARADELGRLAASFSSMTGQVRDGWQRLEDKVAERTVELNQTLRQLQDTQETLVRREKAAMLGQLAAGVGHELRNPLGVMSNAIYYLEFILESSSDEVRDYLRILREQVTLSTKIVTDLLDSARIAPANRRPTALQTIVDAQLERLPRAAHVRFDIDVHSDLPPVDVDPVHIGQAVYNLLTNATQAIGDAEGHIAVSAEAHGDDEVVLRISDDGPGMGPELLDRIFEPLFTTKARGIGLGLSVSRALVQANGGDIAAWSEPGRGATFTVTMPVTARVVA